MKVFLNLNSYKSVNLKFILPVRSLNATYFQLLHELEPSNELSKELSKLLNKNISFDWTLANLFATDLKNWTTENKKLCCSSLTKQTA